MRARPLPFRQQAIFALGLVLTLGLALGTPALGSAQLCDNAALTASRETGVPPGVMLALTRVETGRSRAGVIEPWPWTLNMGGPGSWHDSAEEALAAAVQAIATGRRNIDLGCFQINYHWHGARFTDLRQMLDPLANARYAARFLGDLHAEFGDWTAAVGAFHSRQPDTAARYLARYHAVRADLPDHPAAASAPTGGPAPLPMAARPALASAAATRMPVQGGVRPLRNLAIPRLDHPDGP